MLIIVKMNNQMAVHLFHVLYVKNNATLLYMAQPTGLNKHIYQVGAVSEWVIKFNRLSVDSGQPGPYSPYKPCNDLYIGIMIFPHIDNTQSPSWCIIQKIWGELHINAMSRLYHKDISSDNNDKIWNGKMVGFFISLLCEFDTVNNFCFHILHISSKDWTEIL